MSHVARMNVSCRMYEWVMSHIWMSHVARPHSQLCQQGCVWKCVLSYIWMSHGPGYEWIMSHIWMSHVARMNESCRTYDWVMSHVRISHVARMNESCRTYEWVTSHVWMSHVARMNEKRCSTGTRTTSNGCVSESGWGMSHMNVFHIYFIQQMCVRSGWGMFLMNEACFIWMWFKSISSNRWVSDILWQSLCVFYFVDKVAE